MTVIQDALSDVLTQSGFRQRGDAWYRDVPVGMLVVELQKSEWGEQYYVNLGVYVRKLGQARRPKPFQCHLNTRAEVIDLSQQERWKELLDLETEVAPGRRQQDLKTLITSEMIPFLDSLSTEDGLRSAYSRGELSHAAVTLALKQHLGVG